MTERFTLPRGMHDIYPQEMAQRKWLHTRILDIMQRYSFQLVEPTPLENLETLEAKSGSAIKDEIYFFKDKSKRNLGLRFDLTVGMTRMIANRSDLPLPIKLCSISDMWRYDEPQYARYRHFYQWDAEIYGSDDALADAEIIALSNDILEEIGLQDYTILINSRPLLQGYIESLGITNTDMIEQMIRVVDKSKKLTHNELINELYSLDITQDIIEELLFFISQRGEAKTMLNKLSSIVCDFPNYINGLRALETVIQSIKWYDKLDHCIVDMSVARGIDYYDGIVFEAFDKDGEDIGAILGGGRYNGLGQIYSKRILPATGVAGGIERMILSLQRENLISSVSQAPLVFIASVKKQVLPTSFSIVSELRENNISCELDLKGRNLTRQLEYAESIGARYVVIIGPLELKDNIIPIRNMETRIEDKIPLQSLITYFKKRNK